MTVTAALVKELRARTGAAMMACKRALEQTDGDLEDAISVLRKAGEAKAAKRSSKIAAEGKIAIAVDQQQKVACMVEINSETDFVARSDLFAKFVQQVVNRGLAEQIKDVETLLQLTLDPAGDTTIDEANKALISQLGENIKVRRVALIAAEGVVGHYCHSEKIGVLVALEQDNPDLAKDLAMHIVALKPQALSPEQIPQSMLIKEREILLAAAQNEGKPQNIIDKVVAGRIKKLLNEITLTSQPFFKDPDQTIGALLQSHATTVKTFVRFELGEGIEKEKQDFAAEVMAQVKGKD